MTHIHAEGAQRGQCPEGPAPRLDHRGGLCVMGHVQAAPRRLTSFLPPPLPSMFLPRVIRRPTSPFSIGVSLHHPISSTSSLFLLKHRPLRRLCRIHPSAPSVPHELDAVHTQTGVFVGRPGRRRCLCCCPMRRRVPIFGDPVYAAHCGKCIRTQHRRIVFH